MAQAVENLRLFAGLLFWFHVDLTMSIVAIGFILYLFVTIRKGFSKDEETENGEEN